MHSSKCKLHVLYLKAIAIYRLRLNAKKKLRSYAILGLTVTENKRPTGHYGHLSIRDSALTSGQKGLYLFIIHHVHHERNKNRQWQKVALQTL